MRVIRVFDVILQYVFILLFAGSLVAGVFNTKLFILAGAALLAYFLWGVLRLRCPWCGGAIELSALLRGIRGRCNCPLCGHDVVVVWFVNKKVPEKRSGRGRNPNQRRQDTTVSHRDHIN